MNRTVGGGPNGGPGGGARSHSHKNSISIPSKK